ncbi:PDZ domain-containing protein 8 isoform X2 [Coccinella septempunctata]|uniref:PDZ domain-containing protein 8 isoform X2 n=1 Tax=Coccinella septempunctata TaxID=41139 RepID=UPI001D098C25|nr:PDZ domain-containing protein 8 isoform X2 [Coccinella septempunctata]
MDIFGLFFLSCVSIVLGIVITLVVQYYILYAYFKKSPLAKSPEKPTSDYFLPEALRKQIDSEKLSSDGKDCSLPISLILQFLFHELRHSESIKCWLYKKLSLEFDELLTKTTIGKFFDSISIKDMHLGSQFPDIKEVKVEEVKLDKKEGHIETINLSLNVDYAGNFLLCIDGKTKFAKAAFLSIKVKRICGMVRLQFTRIPYTHWSFSFYTDPLIDLAVESHFQGRQLQSNISNLIVNQIKKAIKRKHTLPNYKIRYKPFFVKTDPSQLDLDDGEIVPQGQLEVNCVEISRLAIPAGIQNIYYTFAVDSTPWICVYQKDDNYYMTLEVILTKNRQSTLGVVFKQDQGQVIVDSVSPHSMASRSGLKPGDVVLSVENKNIMNMPQVAKAIKSTSGTNVTLRIERVADNYVMKNVEQNSEKTENKVNGETSEEDSSHLDQDSFVILDAPKKEKETDKKNKILGIEKTKTPEKLLKTGSSAENMSKLAQTIGSFSLRRRKTSVSDKPSNENSGKNTPASSIPGTPQHSSFKQTISIPVLLSSKKHSISEIPEITKTDADQQDQSQSIPPVEIFRSHTLNSNILLSLNNEYQFGLKENSKYLNVNVWGMCPEGTDLLLGYANIPLNHILNECCNSVLGHYIRRYSFLPPTNVPPNSQTHPLLSHSGFEHVFCYGDILLSFIWSHEEDVELKRKASIVSLEPDGKISESAITSSKHDFVRRQFHRTTQCDFCTKKIWLKDAVQCKNCCMCCHKKCIVKCQLVSECHPSVTMVPSGTQPEITMTEADDLNVTDSEGSQLSNSQSRSLPPSPQRTPSRKQSLTNVNPFLMCPAVLEEIQKNPQESIEAINRLLEQVLLCPADEYLMDAAKESGQQLYNHLTYNERTDKINVMMTELKKSLDHITNEHMELTKQMNNDISEEEKTKLAFLLGKADAKVHGLSVLMLHYCSSLQHSQDKIV